MAKKQLQINKPDISRLACHGIMVLLGAVFAFRCMNTESISGTAMISSGSVLWQATPQILSSFILVIYLGYLIISTIKGNREYSKNLLNKGFLIIIAAFVISLVAASDKRAALTQGTNLLSAMAFAICLYKLSRRRMMPLVFVVLVALGFVNVFEEISQSISSNDYLVQNYNENPSQMLSQFGIEEGSMQHWMFEHRLYSKDIKGYFSTSNSISSYLIMCIFVSLGALLSVLKEKDNKAKLVWAIALTICSIGMIMAFSKGAILSLICGLAFCLVASKLSALLSKYRVITICFILFGMVTVAGIVAFYGTSKGTLPGGNSMHVRWRYWSASGEMAKDYWLTGTGPGNYGQVYPKYKYPGAIETVSDPHNVFISFLCQYGIVGFIGFMLIFIAILNGSFKKTPLPEDLDPTKLDTVDWKTQRNTVAQIAILTLLMRMISFDIPHSGDIMVALYIFITMFLFPAIIISVGAGLLLRYGKFSTDSPVFRTALFSGLIAVLIHNVIDFAFFESGITYAWMLIAVIAVNKHSNASRKENTITRNLSKMLIPIYGTAIICCVAIAIQYYVSLNMLERGLNTSNTNEAISLMGRAGVIDVFSSNPYSISSKRLLSNYQHKYDADEQMLLLALKKSREAISRNPENFKSYDDTVRIYEQLAKNNVGDKKLEYLELAAKYLELSLLKLYPGKAEFHYRLANILEELGDIEKAQIHFKRTLEIEEMFQQEFKLMYGETEKTFRLIGTGEYQKLLDKLE